MLYERRYYEMIGLEIWTPHGKSPPPQIPHTEGKYHWTPRYYEAFPVGDAETTIKPLGAGKYQEIGS